MRHSSINGIVLKSINFKDADKIYSVLTRELGKISVMGRGVRKISSKRAGNLDTLNLISAKIYDNGKGLYQVDEVKTVNSFINIKKSYELSKNAYYLVEIVHKTLEEGADSEEVLNLLGYCLKKLSTDPERTSEIISFFQLRFMKVIGYDLNTDFCIRCGNNIPEELSRYNLDLDRGGFYCGNCNGRGNPVDQEIFNWIKRAKRLDFSKIEKISNVELLKKITSGFTHSKLESKFKSLELI